MGRGEQEWRSGESARLPPMWPGFDSRIPGPTLLNSNSIWMKKNNGFKNRNQNFVIKSEIIKFINHVKLQ